MANADKSIGGSPWDEPLDEVKEEIKSQPTVIGDLDYNKNPNSAPVPAAPKTLNVPKNVEEKVGAKIDAGKIVPPVSQAPQIPMATTKEQTPAAGDDFWHQVYGNNVEENTVGDAQLASTAPTPTPKVSATADVAPAPAPEPIKTVGSLPTPDHLYQPAPLPPKEIVATAKIPAGNNQMPSGGQIPPKSAGSAQSPMTKARSVTSGAKLKMIIIASVAGFVLLLAGGIALTELGIVSVGLEKVYGYVRLEALWKGLPENPENAFAMSAVQMKSEKSFKIEGSATLTVNKGIKSNIITPLVSAVAYPIVSFKAMPAGRQDEELGSKLAAVLAVMEESLVTLESESDTGATNSTVPAPNSGAVAGESSGTSSSGSATASIEELTTDISAKIDENVSGAEIKVKSKKSPNSKVDLIYSNGKFYVKTTNDIVYDKKVKGGWISYDLKKFGTDSPSPKFWSSNFSASNFSIIGNRVGNEDINGLRCYRYSGKVNIGSALESFGLSERSIQSMDIDFWVGVRDHRLYRIEAKVIPNSLSTISRIDLKLTFSDYGGENSNFSLPATSTPVSGGSATSNQTTEDTTGSRDDQRKADLATIAKALEEYHNAYVSYPAVSKVEKISATSGILFTSLVPTFISALPIDPKDPTYYYGYESDGSSFTLSAVLEDTTDSEGKTVGGKRLYFLKNQQ